MLATCPNRQQLHEFLVGTLPPDDADTIAGHLESCTTCQGSLQSLDDGQDSFIGLLRQPAPEDEYAAEPARGRLVDAAKGLLVAAAAGGGHSQTLQPIDQTAIAAELGEYELMEKLGQGGMGAVYKARQKKLKRIVAIKLLPKERLADLKAVARFEREMEAVGAVDHPNVVRAMYAGEHDGTPYLAIEYVDGLSLSDVVSCLKCLRIADACELMRQAAVGLQHAHEKRLVHRDIKPSNLMLTHDGTVKVLDLGLALLHTPASQGAEMTAAGSMMGTADYVAPEQVTDSHSVDIRADVYSLGCTLYKLLSGRAPFVGPEYKNDISKIMAHVQKTPTPITLLRSDVSSDLAAVVERMMAKDPAQRYATPAEVAAALAPFTAGADLRRLMAEAMQIKEPGTAVPPLSLSTVKLSGSAHSDTGSPLVGVLRPEAPGVREMGLAAVPTARAAGAGAGRRRIGIALAAAAAAIPLLLAGWIIIRVRDDKGNVVSELKVPANQTVEIEEEGKPLAKFPAQEKPAKKTGIVRSVPATPKIAAQQAPTIKAGDPIHPFALVTQPAPLPEVRSWTIETRGHRGVVTGLAVHPNGELLASAGDDCVLRLWNTKTGTHIRAFVGEGHAVAWSPDGEVLAAVGANCLVLRETGTWRHLRTIQKKESLGAISAVAWSPDGTLISWSQGATHSDVIQIVRAETGELLHKLPDCGAISWSADGETIAITRTVGQESRFWDVKTGVLNRTSRGMKGWSPDGKLLVAFEGLELKFSDAASGEPVRSITRATFHNGYGNGVVWSPDVRYVAVWGDGAIYDVTTGDRAADVGVCSSIVWAPDQSYVVTGQGDGTINFKQMPSGELIKQVQGHAGGKTAMAWSRGGKSLALAFPSRMRGYIWKPTSSEFPHRFEKCSYVCRALAWSPNGLTLAGLANGNDLGVWDGGTGQLVRTAAVPGTWALCFGWSEDSRRLALSRSDRVTIAEAFSGTPDRMLEEVKGLTPECLAWSPDGSLIAVACANHSADGDLYGIHLFDAASGKALWKRGKDESYYSVAWSPDGKTLAGVMFSEIKLWDRDGNELDTLKTRCAPPDISWSPDGKTMVADGWLVGAPLTLKTYSWDAETGSLRGIVDLPLVTASNLHNTDWAHTARHGSVVAIADGGLVRLWDTTAVRPLGVLALLTDDKSLIISPTGHYRGTPRVERELVYVVDTDEGQETLTPEEFSQKYGWKNDPTKASIETR